MNCAGVCVVHDFGPRLGAKDPGVRGGLQNTGGGLQQGIPIPHPPLISHATKGTTANQNELASFEEGIIRAGQLDFTCYKCCSGSIRRTAVFDKCGFTAMA